jgi:hypothetical protein
MNKNTIIIAVIICLVLGGVAIKKQNNSKNAEIEKISQELETLKNQLSTTDQNSETQNDQDSQEEDTQDLEENTDQESDSDSNDSTKNWQTYYNSKAGFTIKYPPEFNIKGADSLVTLVNYNYNDPRFETGNPDGINIQIQKLGLSPEFNNFADYIYLERYTPSEFNLPAEPFFLGKNITLRQETKDGPGGPMMSFNAFPANGTEYFNIIVFEPGYSQNTKLVESILNTFEIE